MMARMPRKMSEPHMVAGLVRDIARKLSVFVE